MVEWARAVLRNQSDHAKAEPRCARAGTQYDFRMSKANGNLEAGQNPALAIRPKVGGFPRFTEAAALACLAFVFGGSPQIVRGQNAVDILSKNYRVTFENDDFRVVHVVYRPHEQLPLHDHPVAPTVYVYLTDSGPVKFSHVEEQPFILIRPPEKAGTFRFSPGRLEKHTVENSVDRSFLPSLPEMNFLGAWLHSESTASTQLGGFP